ncbi:hypothetical protein AWC01_13895 [Mycobacterium doricum]|uniref:Transposase n=1 Tax=Mycolicibacterium doricum TaxID=126673 RepID=A0A1X1T2X4_9MYCO|nr:hypothetical protein AWC01_13895 [Mycolicibacterium doricum]
MDADLDALATALYVITDDLLRQHPERVPPRPKVGFVPQITDAELLTPAVMQALLGFTSERHWLRHARCHLLTMFPVQATTLHHRPGRRACQASMARPRSGSTGLVKAVPVLWVGMSSRQTAASDRSTAGGQFD